MPPLPTKKPSSQSLISSTLAAIANHFKPHKAEALQRIRLNAVCLVAALILSYLLPVPSLPTAIRRVLRSSHTFERWSSEWVYQWACLLVTAVTIFTFNIAEAGYALKYPPLPMPPVNSPARPKSNAKSPTTTPQRPFKVLSPNSSPQCQKPFSFAPSSPFASASFSMSSVTYPVSPVSTPSRVVHYSIPPGSSSTNTQASSTSTVGYFATPSPVVSAYRGKHAAGNVGRALDGSYLGFIASTDSDEEETYDSVYGQRL
ncbi:uncharacterized protein LACBIDRAFT_303228 [Laccaria bicolor S238N-H82]|uniref:Predicted protein n=1 Tax=Laccaria bicolor (strain S238N-H82 / ATCC MYA-4686) TaxID=486041 RepID=B0DJ61_LACBS|nr:uncharacterized protein LACBIDRAFT_303228 [Laccaria bicolor S238N-H82]EDR05466.1 predicted protein [Laccaria bicolor S238N-H82]|eukprot:XP_001884024.1 predicted protein [Laccaria bicolor S238N-H82]